MQLETGGNESTDVTYTFNKKSAHETRHISFVPETWFILLNCAETRDSNCLDSVCYIFSKPYFARNSLKVLPPWKYRRYRNKKSDGKMKKKQSERSFRNLTNINLYIDVDFYIPWKYVKLSTLLFLLITACIVYGK